MARLFFGRVTAVTALSPASSLLEVHVPGLAQAVLPGQYCMLRCSTPSFQDPFLRRPFYVHGVTGDTCTFLIYRQGQGSRWLASLPVESMLDILGPLGHSWSLKSTLQNLLLVAESSRLPALTFLAHSALKQEISVTFAHYCPDPSLAYPPALFSPEIEYNLISSDLPENLSPSVTWADALCCSVSRETAALLYERYPRLRQPSFSQATADGQIVCGTGLCSLCSLETSSGPHLLCREGPMFDLRSLVR